MATFPYQGFLDGVAYPTIPAGTTTVNVTTSAGLTTKINGATVDIGTPDQCENVPVADGWR